MSSVDECFPAAVIEMSILISPFEEHVRVVIVLQKGKNRSLIVECLSASVAEW